MLGIDLDQNRNLGWFSNLLKSSLVMCFFSQIDAVNARTSLTDANRYECLNR
jgi:hypothetical protein